MHTWRWKAIGAASAAAMTAAILAGCADRSAPAASPVSTEAPRAAASPVPPTPPPAVAACDSSIAFLERSFGFSLAMAPAAPRAGEQVSISASGVRPGTYRIALGIPQGAGSPQDLGRTTVAADGRAAATFAMPATYSADTCLVVWIYPEVGEGLRMARPFLMR